MASLYEIKAELLNIFDQIELAEGEITKEQEDVLAITQENLKEKLYNYHKAIVNWTADIDSCKSEETRIASVRRKYENRIKRLKDAMTDALILFGDDGKNGNKFIELPTCRIFTKSIPKVDVYVNRTEILSNLFMKYVTNLNNNGVLYTGMNVDLSNILEEINKLYIKDNIDCLEPLLLFTLSDLTTLKLDFISNLSIYEYLQKGTILKTCIDNLENYTIKENTSKVDWKLAETIASSNDNKPSCSSISSTTSIQIK